MRSIALVLLISCAAVGSAQAGPWLASLGDEVARATSVEVAVVERTEGVTVIARIVEPIRSSRRVGEVVAYDRGEVSMAAPAVGQRIVSVCDAELCPRLLGVDEGGLFRLHAGSWNTGWAAWISPAIVSLDGLRALVAGRAAPPVCVRGTIDLLDEPAPVDLDLRFDAGSGAGGGTIGGVAVRSGWKTRASVDNFGDGVFVRIGDDARGAMLYTSRVRIEDGCVRGDFWWGWPSPMVRTLEGLREALAGTFGSHAVATGTLRIGAGAPLPAGRYPLRFELDATGELRMTSALATGPITNEHSRSEISGGRPSFGVAVGAPATGELTFLFANTVDNELHHTAAQFVEYVAAHGRASVDVLWVPLPWAEDGRPPAPVPLGRVTLTYVPERGPGRPRPPTMVPQAIAR